MNPTTNKAGRDTAFYAVVTLAVSYLATRVEMGPIEVAAAGTAMFGALTFGYRVLRHYLPWITEV